MNYSFCKRETAAVDAHGRCFSCVDIKIEKPDAKRQAPEHITPPAAFRKLTQPQREALRNAHAGNWLAFFAASIRSESPLAPDIAAKRAAASADSALAVLLDRIPQLARQNDEPINPTEQ